MSLSAKIEMLVSKLDMEDGGKELEKDIKETFPDPSDALKSVDIAINFINSYSQYLSNSSFVKILSKIITGTYEICESIDEFEDLLIRNLLFRLSELNFEYSKKVEMVGKTISDSLSGLPNQVININIQIFFLPIFKDEEFVNWLSSHQMKEVVKIDNSKTALQIKSEVNAWLKNLNLNSGTQEEFQAQLKAFVKAKADEYGLNTNSEEYQHLLTECDEMLAMKLTVISLMMGFEDDEDLTPEPLNLPNRASAQV
jgi:hypothetical protein